MVAERKNIKYKQKAKNAREFFRLNERLRIVVKATMESVKDEFTGEIQVERIEKTSEHYTIDISAGGLQFFSRGNYPDGMHVEITFYFKETDPPFDPVTVNAKILRAERVENTQYYNVSAIYINIDPKDRSQIERYLFVRQREMIAEKRIGYL